MLTFWPLVVLILIAIAVVWAMARAKYVTAEKLRKLKDVSFDAMVARVTASGWHFALERDRYGIWHVNDFAGIKREIGNQYGPQRCLRFGFTRLAV